MNRKDARDRTQELVFEAELDAPPSKVWRALHLPEFRRQWLPDDHLDDPEPVSQIPGREIRYRMADDQPPHVESLVTFEIRPGVGDGTQLRIVHRLTDLRAQPANDNERPLMLAA